MCQALGLATRGGKDNLFFFLKTTFCMILFFFFFAKPHSHMEILVPRPGMEPVSPAMEAQSPKHWTIRESPV